MKHETSAWDEAARYIALRLCQAGPASAEMVPALIALLTPDEVRTFGAEYLLPTLRAYDVTVADALEQLCTGGFSAGRVVVDELEHLLKREPFTMTEDLTSALTALLADNCPENLPTVPIIHQVADRLGLAGHDVRILTVIVMIDEREELQPFLRNRSRRETASAVAAASETDPLCYSRAIAPGAPLVRMGLIDASPRPRRFDLPEPEAVLRTVLLLEDADLLTSETLAAPRGARYELEDFDVPAYERAHLSRALERGGAVLLVGPPGVGKTEFAYALCARLDRQAAVTRYDGETATGRTERPGLGRLRRVMRAAALLTSSSDVLLVDEADALLQSAGGFFGLADAGGYDKAELNAFLDDLPLASIWIANNVERIPSSSLRRFTHVYSFPRPSAARRKRMLLDRAEAHNCALDPTTASRMASGYALTPAAIDRIFGVIDMANPDEEVPRYLEHASTGPFAHDCAALPVAGAAFDPTLCNVTVTLERVTQFSAARSSTGKATRLLFDGPPGGGKTQAALYLAAELGRDAVLRRPSDILSMWVGATEANIARVFQQAEHSGAVLILDEADALLGDRGRAVRSWELSQAAEFLQRIEQFAGVLIACTNRVESMDAAIRRRFHRRVTFGPLTADGIDAALRKLAPGVTFTVGHRARLHRAPSVMLSDIAYAVDLLDGSDPDELVELILSNADGREMTRPLGFH